MENRSATILQRLVWLSRNEFNTTETELKLIAADVTQGKLILASTKNHAHRIYLSNGIYAELTLQYRDKRWQKLPWTYPDYCQDEYHEFFKDCRDYLRNRLRQTE